MPLVTALFAGLLFGTGLIISGMTDPAKVIGFLDLAGHWNPSLALVMAGALMVAAPTFRFAAKRSGSTLGEPIQLPATRPISIRLVAGSLAFGIGWGLAGYCPGPVMASLLSGGKPRIFFIAMLAGMAIFEIHARFFLQRPLNPAQQEQAMLISVGLGMLVGVILALTGAGGGILAVPLLVFGAGIGMRQAGPISLLAVGIAAMLGAGIGLKNGIVRYKAALLMAASGILFSPLGVLLAQHADNRWLSLLFALILLFVAYRTFRQADQRPDDSNDICDRTLPCVRDAGSGRFVWTARCARSLALAGSMTGLLSGLLGVGGGFVTIPTLRRFTDLNMQSAVATSLAVIALVSIAGITSSAVTGQLEWAIGMPFAAGAMIGMFGGRLAASRLAGAQMQKGFAIVSALAALGMLAKTIW